jgi:hypothetical protein
MPATTVVTLGYHRSGGLPLLHVTLLIELSGM